MSSGKGQRIIIGIDPGLHGAICILNGKSIAFYDAPIIVTKTGKKESTRYLPEQMAALLRPWVNQNAMVVLEISRAMPKQSSQSGLSIGIGWGLWRGIAAGVGLAVESVDPAHWKRVMLGKGAGTDKGASILRASALFPQAAADLQRPKQNGAPGYVMLDGRAEALLIATFYRDQGR